MDFGRLLNFFFSDNKKLFHMIKSNVSTHKFYKDSER
jgi:hypothetical protein